MISATPGNEPGPGRIIAQADMGSAVSRNGPGRRHIVRLSAPGHSVIVAGGLSETAARRLAEAINDFVIDALGGQAPEPPTCPLCATEIQATGRGRPPRYCSPACRQQAYRDRQRG
jgi:tRNA(Ile2) C34 agmatinyltransferase TiaS